MFNESPEEYKKVDALCRNISEILHGQETKVGLQALARTSAITIHATARKDCHLIAAFKIWEEIVQMLSLLPDKIETKDEKNGPA